MKIFVSQQALTMRLPLAIAAAALTLQVAECGTDNHKYKEGDHIELWVNKVRNPSGDDALQRPAGEEDVNPSVIVFKAIKTIIRLTSFPTIHRSDRTRILKRHMNIIRFRTVHQKQSIIQMKRAVDSMNGRVTTWVKSLVDTLSVILGMILHF